MRTRRWSAWSLWSGARVLGLGAALAVAALAVAPAAAGPIAAGYWVADDYSGTGTWNNRNASFNDATPTALTTYRTKFPVSGAAINSHSSIFFNAYDQARLDRGADFTVAGSASVPAGGTNPASGARAITWTAVFQTRGGVAGHGDSYWRWSGLFGNERPGGGRGDYAMSYTGTNAGGFQSDTSITGTSGNFNNDLPHVYSLSIDSSGVMHLWLDGQNQRNVTSSWLAGNASRTLETTDSAFSIGASTTLNNADTWFIHGDMAEARIDSFAGVGASASACLTVPQIVLLHNHLSSKYGTTMLANDLYAGDTPANGNYDNGVFGIANIGGVSVSSENDSWLTSLGSSGLMLTALGGSLDDGEALLAGHSDFIGSTVPAVSLLAEALPGGFTSRWSRVWYLDVTGTVDADLAFDYSDAGLAWPTTNVAWSLLYSPTDALNWSVVNVSPAYQGDAILFDLPSASLLDGYYTLAQKDIPEPASLTLLALGGLALLRRRRKA